jgi:hypothetical protein
MSKGIFSGKAAFYSLGKLDVKNCRVGVLQMASVGLAIDYPKMNVFCALLELKVCGLLYIESIITGDISLDMLEQRENFQHVMMLFQRDNAPPRYRRKCDSLLMTSYQDLGLGHRDRSLGLRSHLTLFNKLILLRVCR